MLLKTKFSSSESCLYRGIALLWGIFLILNVLLLRGPLSAQESVGRPITITTQVSRATMTIGDKVEYTITVHANPELKVEFPQFGDNMGGFAIKDFGEAEPKKHKGRMVYRQRYTLDSYTTGSHTIPAPLVFYTDADGRKLEIEGEAVTIEVKSVLPEDEEPQDIKDIPDPVELPVNNTALLVGIIIGALFIAGGVAAFLWLKKRKESRDEIVRKPPHVIAYEQLEKLVASGLIEAGRIEEYYVLLSDTIRTYLENRFGLRAPEMTTEEFLAAAANNSVLKDEHKKMLSRFLTHCDLVKFARYAPDVEEMNSAYESAKQFVHETAPVETQIEEVL